MLSATTAIQPDEFLLERRSGSLFSWLDDYIRGNRSSISIKKIRGNVGENSFVVFILLHFFPTYEDTKVSWITAQREKTKRKDETQGKIDIVSWTIIITAGAAGNSRCLSRKWYIYEKSGLHISTQRKTENVATSNKTSILRPYRQYLGENRRETYCVNRDIMPSLELCRSVIRVNFMFERFLYWLTVRAYFFPGYRYHQTKKNGRT